MKTQQFLIEIWHGDLLQTVTEGEPIEAPSLYV